MGTLAFSAFKSCYRQKPIATLFRAWKTSTHKSKSSPPYEGGESGYRPTGSQAFRLAITSLSVDGRKSDSKISQAGRMRQGCSERFKQFTAEKLASSSGLNDNHSTDPLPGRAGDQEANMPIPFEPTRSYVYRAARYELLPRIAEIARNYGDEPFLLREISKSVLSETYTAEQLETRIKKANSDATEKMSNIFGFYIPFLAEELRVFEKLGGGMFKNISIDEELAEADAVATDVESNDSGIIYAYSFPSITRDNSKFPIKVGLTTTGEAEARVTQQCRQTCCFEYPVVLKTWQVQRVAAVEDAIHATLKARGSKRQAPGTEWFDTTLDEIERIIEFVQSSN